MAVVGSFDRRILDDFVPARRFGIHIGKHKLLAVKNFASAGDRWLQLRIVLDCIGFE